MTRARWVWLGVAVAVLALVQAAIHAGSPRTVEPSGVDSLPLVVEDLATRDFVDEIDHPWYPFTTVSSWSYRTVSLTSAGASTAGQFAEGQRSRELEVTGRLTVAGVPVTEVTTVLEAPVGSVNVEYYAQDVDGHVWLVDAATRTATLAAPAQPRRGDGWLRSPGDPQGVTWRLEEHVDCPPVRAIDRDATSCDGGEAWAVTEVDARGQYVPTTHDLVVVDGIGVVTRTRGLSREELVSYS